MHISPFKGFIPDLTKISFNDAFYQHMREDFNSVWQRGLFKSVDESASFYILEIEDHRHIATGLISLTSMEDYTRHRILKHEKTIAAKEKIHLGLHASRMAMIKPAALLIRKHAGLNKIISAIKTENHPVLVVKFPDHQTLQRLWKITDTRLIQKIAALFDKNIDQAIIADGHHRFASLAHRHSIKNPKHILTIYFSPEEMKVSTFYRIINKLKSESYQAVIDRLKRISLGWRTVDTIKPAKGVIHLICQDQLFKFRLKTQKNDPIQLTFSQKIIQKVFNIHNESNSKRIRYVEYPDLPEEHRLIVDQHREALIFILPPLTAQQVLKNKKLLPPKSTMFTPRIINGLIVVKQ